MKNRAAKSNILATALRALAICLAIGAPVLAMPAISGNGGTNSVIESPAPEKTGMGFVLLVSLQRA